MRRWVQAPEAFLVNPELTTRTPSVWRTVGIFLELLKALKPWKIVKCDYKLCDHLGQIITGYFFLQLSFISTLPKNNSLAIKEDVGTTNVLSSFFISFFQPSSAGGAAISDVT